MSKGGDTPRLWAATYHRYRGPRQEELFESPADAWSFLVRGYDAGELVGVDVRTPDGREVPFDRDGPVPGEFLVPPGPSAACPTCGGAGVVPAPVRALRLLLDPCGDETTQQALP